MTKHFIAAAFVGAALIGQTSCNSKKEAEFKKKGALEYAIIKDEEGKNANVGDIIDFNIIIKSGDSVIADSRKDNNGNPAQMQLPPSQSNIDWFSVLTEFSAGDSGVIRLSVDSIKKTNGGMVPPFMKDGEFVTFEVSIISVKTKEEAEKEAKEKAAKQTETDDKTLQEYFQKNGINPQKTENGVYYVIQKEGAGKTPSTGDMVSVKYTGKTLAGVTFDSNVDTNFHHTDPFKFPIGQGAVIPGWDEGVSKMKKGSKATLYIPSPLAYGAQSPGPEIAPNSILTFDVEVLDITDAPAAPANAQQMSIQ